MKLLSAIFLCVIVAAVLYRASGPSVVEQPENKQPSSATGGERHVPTASAGIDRLLELAPGYSQEHAEILVESYGRTALNVARDHGSVGLDGLRVLGTEGVELIRSQPDTFRLLAERLGSERGIRLLALLEDQVVDVARHGGLPMLIDRVEGLSGEAARLGNSKPQLLPLLILAPEQVTAVIRKHPDVAPQCLMIVDLAKGPTGVLGMCDVIEKRAEKARQWFDARGADGLFLAHQFPDLVEHNPRGSLPEFLQMLRTNAAFMASLHEGEPRRLALAAIDSLLDADAALPALGDADPVPADGRFRGLLVRIACDDPHTVRLVMEHGQAALEVMTATAREWAASRASVPRLLYEAYDPAREPLAHRHAWGSLTIPESRRAALFALQAFARWPELAREDLHPQANEFLSLLSATDSRFPAWAAENEWLRQSSARKDRIAADEAWKSMMEQRTDFLDAQTKTGSEVHEFLPLYDTCRLLWVLGKGYTPTTGDVIFAVIDVVATAWDLATLGAGSAATGAIKGGAKGLGKTALELGEQAVKKTGREQTQSAVSRASNGILATVARSPAVVRQLANTGVRRSATGLEVMARGALAVAGGQALGIPIRIGRYVVSETAINYGVSEGIESAILFAQQNPNQLIVKQVNEVIAFIADDPEP